jgi:hypothetical protein
MAFNPRSDADTDKFYLWITYLYTLASKQMAA